MIALSRITLSPSRAPGHRHRQLTGRSMAPGSGLVTAFRAVALVFLLKLVVWGGSAHAAPANDKFANVTLISGTSGTLSGSTATATKETGEPIHAGRSGGHSVWYRWTAPNVGRWFFRTAGSS